ncbi:MAG TPA: hypothetical protein VGM23_04400 [Armatimonadota bacterium]
MVKKITSSPCHPVSISALFQAVTVAKTCLEFRCGEFRDVKVAFSDESRGLTGGANGNDSVGVPRPLGSGGNGGNIYV